MDDVIDLIIERALDVDENDSSDNSPAPQLSGKKVGNKLIYTCSFGKDSMASFLAKIIRKKKEREADSAGVSNRSTEVNISYDLSLPALHSYLGSDLEELSGRTVLDDDSCQTIPLLTLPGVVLIPGQTLPLQLFNPATVSMMTHIINSDRTFGLINSRFSGRTFNNAIDPIGTTAEIRSYREEQDSYSGLILRIKAEGRQRFEVLETRRQVDGIMVGKVRILPELALEDPGLGSKLNSLDKFRNPPPNWSDDSTPCSSQSLSGNFHKYNKYDFANYTSFPSFVYKMYDPHVLMKRIQNELIHWNTTLKAECMPCNPKDFSYWVAANLPLDDNQRIVLLSINEVTQRLRQELKILEECSLLCCRDCMNVIANREDIFSMSLQGPQGTYVNPNGYVHEAITLYKTKNLVMLGRSSTEQSWFPGYAWTIAECAQCHCHMGWLFTATDKKLKPSRFWALCRAAIRTRLSSSFSDVNPELNDV